MVGEAGTAAQALARIPALRPDVAILDVRLPDGDGVTVCRDIRSAVTPPPACLMLTSYSDDEALFGAIMAGASGYLLKQVAGIDLVGAVRTVAAGGSLLDPKATAAVLERLRKRRRTRRPRSPHSARRNDASSNSSPTASPTARSGPRCSSPRRRSRTTSPRCCTSSACPAAPKPPSTPPRCGSATTGSRVPASAKAGAWGGR